MEEKTGKEMPSIDLSININGDVIKLNLPSIGGFINIERRKIALSGDTHKNMIMGVTESSLVAYRNVEMIASLEVLIPDIEKRLKVESLTELKPFEVIELTKEYDKKIFPWLESWRKFINSPSDMEEVIKENKEESGK